MKYIILMLPILLLANSEVIKINQTTYTLSFKHEQGSISISSRKQSCSQIKDDTNDFLNIIGSELSFVDELDCYCLGFTCKIELSDYIPIALLPIIEPLQNYNGPNCWNTSLKHTGLIQESRFVNNEELELWLSSDYCEKVNHKDRKANDLIVLKMNLDRNKDHVHSYIYFSDDISYSKDGKGYLKNPLIQDTSKVFKFYLRYQELDLEKNKHCLFTSDKECEMKASFYRCSKFPNIPKPENRELLDTVTIVDNLESIISRKIHKQRARIGILEMQELTNQKHRLAKISLLNRQDQFLANATVHKINSLLKQIYYISKLNKALGLQKSLINETE